MAKSAIVQSWKNIFWIEAASFIGADTVPNQKPIILHTLVGVCMWPEPYFLLTLLTTSSDPGKDHSHSEVVECQSGLHPQRISQQESRGPSGMQQRVRIRGDHDTSIFQNHRMGRGKSVSFRFLFLHILGLLHF